MKRFYLLCIFQAIISGYLYAQPGMTNKNDSIALSSESASYRTNIFPEKGFSTSIDSMSVKWFSDSISTYKPDFFLNNKSFNYLNKNKISDALHFNYKILPKQKYYFAIHDYSTGWNLRRVSRWDNPHFDYPEDNHYLWSGHLQPYRETGFSRSYFDTNDNNPPLLIYIIRHKGKIRGYGIEQLTPHF